MIKMVKTGLSVLPHGALNGLQMLEAEVTPKAHLIVVPQHETEKSECRSVLRSDRAAVEQEGESVV